MIHKFQMLKGIIFFLIIVSQNFVIMNFSAYGQLNKAGACWFILMLLFTLIYVDLSNN